MQYQYLGKSGLQVSRLSFGNWLTSNTENAQQNVIKCVNKAWEMGINYFDTAEAYGIQAGDAEIQMGIALKALNIPREKLVISTKLFSTGLTRKHIIEGLQNSLKRLQLDYVDIIFAHRFDHIVPMEEVCRAFNYVIEKGWAFYWGTSKWSAQEIQKAYEICDKLGLIRPIVEQCQYNMLIRDQFEVEYRGLFSEFNMGSTVWSPLAGGVLTGKYNDGIKPGSRLFEDKNQKFYYNTFLDPKIYDKRIEQLKALEELAKQNDITQTQLALAWILINKRVSTAIIGASSPDQVEECCKALEFLPKFTQEIEEKIESILKNTPNQIINWLTFQPFEKQR